MTTTTTSTTTMYITEYYFGNVIVVLVQVVLVVPQVVLLPQVVLHSSSLPQIVVLECDMCNVTLYGKRHLLVIAYVDHFKCSIVFFHDIVKPAKIKTPSIPAPQPKVCH